MIYKVTTNFSRDVLEKSLILCMNKYAVNCNICISNGDNSSTPVLEKFTFLRYGIKPRPTLLICNVEMPRNRFGIVNM
jgi:hypothetical protein